MSEMCVKTERRRLTDAEGLEKDAEELGYPLTLHVATGAADFSLSISNREEFRRQIKQAQSVSMSATACFSK